MLRKSGVKGRVDARFCKVSWLGAIEDDIAQLLSVGAIRARSESESALTIGSPLLLLLIFSY